MGLFVFLDIKRVHWQVEGANYILLTNDQKRSRRQKVLAQIRSPVMSAKP